MRKHLEAQLKFDDGRIETGFEVDQNRIGKRWGVVLRQDGVVKHEATSWGSSRGPRHRAWARTRL